MHLPTVWDLQCTGVVVSEVKSWLTRGASTVRAARADRRRPHGRLRRPDGRRRPSNRSTAYMAAAFVPARVRWRGAHHVVVPATRASPCRCSRNLQNHSWNGVGCGRTTSTGFLGGVSASGERGRGVLPSLITDSLYFNGSTCQWLLLFSARRLLHPSICVPFFCACGSRRRATTRGQCQIRVVVMSWREKKLHGD